MFAKQTCHGAKRSMLASSRVMFALPLGGEEMNGFLALIKKTLTANIHDPIMPLNIESDVTGGVRKIAERFYGFCKTMENLDITPIEKYLM